MSKPNTQPSVLQDYIDGLISDLQAEVRKEFENAIVQEVQKGGMFDKRSIQKLKFTAVERVLQHLSDQEGSGMEIVRWWPKEHKPGFLTR